jgi:hypothetical protein
MATGDLPPDYNLGASSPDPLVAGHQVDLYAEGAGSVGTRAADGLGEAAGIVASGWRLYQDFFTGWSPGLRSLMAALGFVIALTGVAYSALMIHLDRNIGPLFAALYGPSALLAGISMCAVAIRGDRDAFRVGRAWLAFLLQGIAGTRLLLVHTSQSEGGGIVRCS